MIEVPDFAQPIEAWRVWRVVEDADGEVVLGSVVQPTLWAPGNAFSAECLRCRRPWVRLRRRRKHDAPQPGCECGIYASSLHHVGQYLNGFAAQSRSARVLGQVFLWGTVVECDRGFRASHAYPSRIYVPADAGRWRERGCEQIAFGLWRYDVPVELLDSRYADATRVLAERLAA